MDYVKRWLVYMELMLPVILLVIWSYPFTLLVQTTPVYVSISFVRVSSFGLIFFVFFLYLLFSSILFLL